MNLKLFSLTIQNKEFINYFNNSALLLFEKILRIISGLIIWIWLAKYFGPEQFGLFSYAQSFAFLFTVLAALGLDNIIVREIVKNPFIENDLIWTSFILKIFGSIIVLLLILISVKFTNNDENTNVMILIFGSVSVFKSFNVIEMYFQSKMLNKYSVYVYTITLLFIFILQIILILNEAKMITFASVLVFESFIVAAGLLFFYIKKSKYFLCNKIFFNKKIAIDLLKDSWPLILTSMIISIYMKIDQVMIKEMLGLESVGYYAAATKISEAIYFIPVVICVVLFPAILNAKKKSIKLYYSRLQGLYTFMVWFAILLSIIITLLSNWLISVLYGTDYSISQNVLLIHIWASVFVFLGVAFSKYLLAENLTKKSLYKAILGLLVNVLLNYLMIPVYGINGAAFATLIGQFCANVIYDFLDKDLRLQLLMKFRAFLGIFMLLKINYKK